MRLERSTITFLVALVALQHAVAAQEVPKLGYANLLKTGEPGLVIHFQLGGAAPDNECTRTAALSSGAAGRDTRLHLAMSASGDQAGYLSLAFAGKPGQMIPADGVIATDPAAPVKSYHIGRYGVGPADETHGWADGMGVVQQGGTKILCFSRQLNSAEAAVVKQIDPKAPLNLNWALGYSNQLALHSKAGAVTLLLDSPGSSSVISDNGGSSLSYDAAIWTHGALMLAAFVLLMPSAALMARHKWLAGDAKTGSLKPIWFKVHRACACLALMAATAAFVLIFVRFRWIQTGRVVNTYTGHRAVGITAVALMVIQGLLGAFRPHLGTPQRPIWRRLHQACGWLTIAMGTAACYMGITLAAGITAVPLPWFLAPPLAVTCLLVIGGVVLEVRKVQLERAGRYDKHKHVISSSSTHPAAASGDVQVHLEQERAGSKAAAVAAVQQV